MKNYTLLTILILLSVITIAQQATFNWNYQEISAGNNLQKMTIDNNEAIIAGSGRTFLKSTDNGNTWNDAGVLKASFDFIDLSFKGNTGYLAGNRFKLYDAFPNVYTNGILLTTNDAGETWMNVDLGELGTGDDPALDPTAETCYALDFQSVGSVNDSVAYCFLRWLEYDPNEASGTITHSGIFKTNNKGATWKNLSGDLGSTMIMSIAFSDTTGYIAGNKKLYRTSANSEVLTDIFANLNTGGNGFVNDIDLIDKDEFYAVTVGDGVFKSTDGGATFSKFNIPGINGGNDIFKVNDSTIMLAGGAGKSRISIDSGTTWTECGITVAIWEVGGVFNDSLYLLAKSDMYKISVADVAAGNAGSGYWKKSTLSEGNNLHKAHVFDDNKMMVIGLGPTFKMTRDKGATWNDITHPTVPVLDSELDFSGLRVVEDTAYASLNHILFIEDNTNIYLSGGILKTTNNWDTYSSVNVALIGKDEGNDPSRNPHLPFCNGFNPSVIEYAGNNIILVWARWSDLSTDPKTEHSRIFRSTDGGKTSGNWEIVSDDFLKGYVQDIKINGDTGYVCGNKIFLKSVDRGKTFTNIYTNLDPEQDDDMFINSITLGDENELFVTTSGDGVYRSTDGGTTFARLSGSSGANDFFKFDDNSWIFLGSSGKSMFTNDEGTSWMSCHPSNPNVTALSVFEIGGVLNDSLYALGKGYLYKLSVPDLYLKVSVPEILSGNGLKISYKSNSIELVSSEKNIDVCRVYSLSGQLITITKPFSRRVELQNNAFTPGVYIVSAMAGGKVYNNKVVFK